MYKLTFFLLISWLSFFSYGEMKPDVVVTTGHNDQVNAIAVSPNNKFLASAGNNKILKIWDVASNKEFRTISGTDGRVTFLTFSPNNIYLAGNTTADQILIWNVITGEELFNIKAVFNYSLTFFDNGNKLAFINEESHFSYFDLKTGQTTVLGGDLYCNEFVVDGQKNIAYVSNIKGEMVYFDLNTNQEIKRIKLFDKAKFVGFASKLSNNGNYIVNVFLDNKIRVFDIAKEKYIYTSKAFDSKIVALEIDQVNPHIYFTLHDGTVVFFDYLTQKNIFSYKDQYFIANAITSYSTGEAVIVANYNVIKFIDIKTKKPFKLLKPKVSKIWNLAYDQQGEYLAVANNKVKVFIWDLKKNRIVDSLNGFFPCEFSPDGKELITMSYTTDMATWETKSWQQTGTYKTEGELIQKIAYSPDGKYIAGSGYNQVVKVWDRNNRKLIKKLKGHTGGILALDFHPTKPILASGSHDGTLKVWDFMHEKEIQSFSDQIISVSGVKFSPDGKLLASASWDKTILLRNTDNWEIVKKLEGHTNSVIGVDFNKTGEVLVSFAGNNSVDKADNSLIFWNTKTGEQICQVADHQSGITKAFFDLDADYVFSGSEDGTLKITDYKKQKTIATYLAIGSKEFMIYTPDNYYIASRNALQSIAFRIDNKLISFEQFDIYLNRPDIVAKEIGKSPPMFIRAYEYLHKKRLRKYNINDEGNLNLDYHIPNIINESDLPLITSEDAIKVTLKAWDDKYDIKAINVYVNGTPIYGETGYTLETPVKSYRTTFNIPLIEGKNKIQISAVNSNQAESIYESFEIVKEITNKKSNLYMVGIGVSNYKDNRFNLTYPTKDAKDMTTKLGSAALLYDQIYTKTLLDDEVTIENFVALNAFFKDCKEDDIAIIFIAGHGVLDANFDYYFGTYDIDFNNPENRGLAYDKIHELLNKIRSYRKLLIMDTCHSGELDKEEIEQGPAPEVDDSDLKFRGTSIGVVKKEALGFENTIELVEDVFSDTRKGSGAIVISSAGGAEYAIESDEWQNGLFTYAFIKGFEMESKNQYQQSIFNADYDKNGSVEVSEIRKYVYEVVKEKSGNKQKPSSREENIDQDYPIYKETQSTPEK
ncbi:MAG: caspase family protein [Putridiphycobacter sp.]